VDQVNGDDSGKKGAGDDSEKGAGDDSW
jgi:hypothetical protein